MGCKALDLQTGGPSGEDLMTAHGGWYAVDLDGTLAEYHGWRGIAHIGDPIPAMVDRVKRWLAEGRQVKVFTARVATRDGEELKEVQRAIADWTKAHIGVALPVTCVKDFGMICLFDDRCCRVEQNTGRVIGEDDA